MVGAARACSTTRINRDDLECVQGQMAFARRSPEERAPEVFFPRYEAIPMVSHEVTIRNARPIVDDLSLDREGFALVQHKTSCAKERNAEILADRYLEEMVPFLKDYFNAAWVVPKRDGVIVRSAAKNAATGIRGTAGMAHIDYAPISAPMLAARENHVQGLPIRSYSRLMIIQAWRAVSPPPQDIPLALCDSASVLDTDVLVHDYVSDIGADWKSCLLYYSPLYRWYYFPDMTQDELILFKGYDSEENCNARAAHTGFDNRRAYPNALPRESIEARFYVYYA
ncbi:CmcJ/NvfI family oxidoreductase [Bradyrhizobium yuanmingense]|uniref:CmcJ/NvfI family oxidoreductase n=1 Tax=Bradyrhizobium yuanmingense TaxID=108015 RepID=UPI0023BA294A|nr:CmcJ/NvfI family oxidoreductase [Bradyrhizobium yuanmingense]MDF0498639.1 CmcJ/NvfI family oxidoreductase [Bradyrhizobium yuanmingense]